ncbi:cytochrome c oxidase subunit VII Cox7 [Coemansia spiralis]|nr:cytochrome c oxidase subunit VII Cox7 [Coemansia spiralis]
MKIIEKQRFYQSGHGPTYLRTPVSRFAVRSVFGLVIGGSLFACVGLGRLIAGQKP